MPTFVEESACANVIGDSLSSILKAGWYTYRMIIYRKSAMSESSKAAKQQPVIEEVTPSVAAASVPPPAVRTCMTACSNADASTLLDEFFNMWRV
jgi:hypothetical protein